MKTILILISLILMSYCYVVSQEIISTGGDYYKNSSLSVSYTIGEPISETFVAGENVLTQGFQQSKLIITAIETPEANNFKLQVFPNPTHSIITIENTEEVQQTLQYALYDLNGKVLYETHSDENMFEINLANLSPGTYILRITNDEKQMATYKIEKN
jgi:hypothetical protein